MKYSLENVLQKWFESIDFGKKAGLWFLSSLFSAQRNRQIWICFKNSSIGFKIVNMFSFSILGLKCILMLDPNPDEEVDAGKDSMGKSQLKKENLWKWCQQNV